MSFFGLMPIGGLVVPGVSDLIGMRTALAVASVIYGIAAALRLKHGGSACLRPPGRARLGIRNGTSRLISRLGR